MLKIKDISFVSNVAFVINVLSGIQIRFYKRYIESNPYNCEIFYLLP